MSRFSRKQTSLVLLVFSFPSSLTHWSLSVQSRVSNSPTRPLLEQCQSLFETVDVTFSRLLIVVSGRHVLLSDSLSDSIQSLRTKQEASHCLPHILVIRYSPTETITFFGSTFNTPSTSAANCYPLLDLDPNILSYSSPIQMPGSMSKLPITTQFI